MKLYKLKGSLVDFELDVIIDPMGHYGFDDFEAAADHMVLIPSFALPRSEEERLEPMHELVCALWYAHPSMNDDLILDGVIIRGTEGDRDLVPIALFKNQFTAEIMAIYDYGITVFWVDGRLIHSCRID